MEQYKRSRTSTLRASDVQNTVGNLMDKGRHFHAHRILFPGHQI